MAVTIERPPAVKKVPAPPAVFGPAVRTTRLPMGSLSLSIGLHLLVVLAIIVAMAKFNERPPAPMVVSLVPAVAAIGSPRGEASAPPEPTLRPEPPAPRPEPAAPRPQMPAPPTPRVEMPVKPRPLPVRDLPSRERTQNSIPLPEPSALMPRSTAPTLPRFDQREAPALPTPTAITTNNPLPPPIAAKPAAQTAVSASPPLPLGRADGSPRGAGAVTVDGDFPFAWYIAAIQRKISEQWQDKALPGNQPTVVFEIGRDGQLTAGQLLIEKSSGNGLYDRAAARAIEDAKPFPPLPPEFPASLLRIHVSFAYIGDGLRVKP